MLFGAFLLNAVIIVAIYGMGLFGIGFFLNGMAGLDRPNLPKQPDCVFGYIHPDLVGYGCRNTRAIRFFSPAFMADLVKLDGRISAWRLSTIFVIVLLLELLVLTATWVMGAPPYAQ